MKKENNKCKCHYEIKQNKRLIDYLEKKTKRNETIYSIILYMSILAFYAMLMWVFCTY